MGLPNYKTDLEPFFSNESEPSGAKLCKLNKFLKSAAEALKSASDLEKDNFIKSIPTDSYFANKTRLELASILQRPEQIFETWKSEDTTLLHRSLSILWIFRDNSVSPLLSQNPDFVVNSLFPSLSSKCRTKVVKQMGKWCVKEDAKAVTTIYSKLLETYGLKLAQLLIPACSQPTIDSLIEAQRVKFEHNQLLALYKKWPESAMKYFHGLYQALQPGGSDNNDHNHHPCLISQLHQFFTHKDSCPVALREVAKSNPSEFMNLFETYDGALSSLKFGHGMTLRLIKHDKDRIISGNKAPAYANLLCQRSLMRKLSNSEFEVFFRKLFPKNLDAFQHALEIGDGTSPSLFSWLGKYPLEKRFENLESTFKDCYAGKNLLDYPEYVSSKMIQLMSPDQRDKWIDYRMAQQGMGNPWVFNLEGIAVPSMEAYWEAFRSIDKSIPKIKQYLATESDVHRRGELLSYLVLSCSINNDKSALKEICQHVSSRYRNDQAQVRLEFLSTISTLFDPIKDLDEDHWKPINELLHISSINNEFSYRLNVLEGLLEKSIHFRVARDLPVDTQIQHYIKMKSRSYNMGESWCVAPSDPVVERKCLKLFTEHLSSLYPLSTSSTTTNSGSAATTTPLPSDSAITSSIISLFESYAGWNRRRKNSKIHKSASKAATDNLISAAESPWLMKRLQDVLDSYHEGNKARVISAMNHDPQAKAVLRPRLLKSAPVPSIVSQLLKKDPKKLNEMMDQVLDFILASNNVREWERVLAAFKSSGIPKLTEKFANKCLEIADDEEESLKERSNSIYILSFLLETSNYVGWIPKFYPSSDPPPKYDHYNAEEIGVVYGIRKAITQSLCNLSSPSLALPALSQFCKGDYLKLTTGSLHSVIQKCPPGPKLLQFLQELATRPVSIKKHAIRLMISISTKEENVKFLESLWASEKHHSIRTILFTRIFEFFIQNNSETSWKLLESSVNSLTALDQPFLSELARRDWILSPGMPNDRLSPYLSMALGKLDALLPSLPDIKWVQVNLIQCIISGNIGFLQESLIHSIFQQHLFNLKEEANMQSALVTLALNYLLYYNPSGSSSSKKMEIITTYLEKLLGPGSSWNSVAKDSYTSYPAKQSLSFFIEQLAMASFSMGSKGAASGEEILKIFSQLQKYLRASQRNVCEFFVDDLFLSFALIFHTHCSKEGGPLSEKLIQTGKKIGQLVDGTVGEMGAEVISIFSEALKRFVGFFNKNRRMPHNVHDDDEEGDLSSNEGIRIIFIVEGILGSTGSIDTQIVASQLLLTSSFSVPRKGSKYEEKFARMVHSLREVKDKTVQIFVNYASSQCRANRGFDILV